MAEVEMNQLVPGTTICWSCQNKFTMPPGATMAACPFCQNTNQVAPLVNQNLPVGQPINFPMQQPMMMQPQMMQPQMVQPMGGGQVSVVMVTQQPQQQQPIRQYFEKPSARNLCATLSFLYFAMAWIVMGLTTPGWRKIVYFTNVNPDDGTSRSGFDKTYKISVGIGFYEYAESAPKWLSEIAAPPVVGSGRPAEYISLTTDCYNKNYTWLDPPQCETFKKVQALSIPTLILSVLLPLFVHFAINENKKSFGNMSMLMLGTALTGLMITMFAISEQILWDSLHRDPRLGNMHYNGYGFGYGFFCVGFIFLAVADAVFLCTGACN